MKNIKKLLALALVLVLALGMVPFVAASGPADMNVTDYPDFNSITEEQREAVDVLTALGVLQGDAGGFRPQDTITRAEAAKIIAYIRLGTATAEALPVMTNNTFADVGPDHWANKFVEYGATQGIISGHGDGYFRPEDPVTGIQIGKMLLTALGYGVNGEFEGPGWELAVIDRARLPDVRVLTGTGEGVDFSAPANREQVAQYTFNTLYITRMVSWNSTINDYSFWSQTVAGTQNRPTLGNNTFRLGYETGEDLYGFEGRVWVIVTTGRELTDWYMTDAILGRSTNGTPIDTLNPNSRSLTVRGRAGFVAPIEERMNYTDATGTSAISLFVNGENITDDRNANSMQLNRNDAFRLAATPGVIVYLVDHLSSTDRAWDTGTVWNPVTGTFVQTTPDIRYLYEHNGRVDRVVIIAKTAHEAGGPPLVATNGNVTITGVNPRDLRFMLSPTNQGRYNSGTGVTNNVRVDIPATLTSLDAITLTPSIVDRPADTVIYPEGIVRGDVLLVHTAVEDGVRITIVEKAESIDGQMTSVRLAAPANITFGGETYNQSGLTPTALFQGPGPATANLANDWQNGYWAQDISNENHLFAMTRTGVNNLNVDATIWLDDNGDVVRARRAEPGDAVWGLITGFEADGVLQGTLKVRLTTSDGVTDDYIVARRGTQTIAGIITALESAVSAKGPGPAANSTRRQQGGQYDSLMAALVAYNILDDGRVQITFPGSTTGTGNTASAAAGASVPRTLNGTGTSVSSYTARRNPVAFDNDATRFITGDTVVFYFDLSNGTVGRASEGNYGWHATNNPVTVGIGPNGANMDINSTTGVRYVVDSTIGTPTALSNVQAVWFDMRSDGRGTSRWAFLTNTGSTSHESPGGTPVYTFNVWTLDNHASTIRADRVVDEPPDRTALSLGGIGLYQYFLDNRGLATVAPAPGNFQFPPGSRSIATPSQIVYADEGIIRYRGMNDRTANANFETRDIAGDWANNGPIYVHPNTTQFFRVELADNRTTGSVIEYGPDYLETDLYIEDRDNEHLSYFLLGVQPGIAPGDPAVAVYFYDQNVPANFGGALPTPEESGGVGQFRMPNETPDGIYEMKGIPPATLTGVTPGNAGAFRYFTGTNRIELLVDGSPTSITRTVQPISERLMHILLSAMADDPTGITIEVQNGEIISVTPGSGGIWFDQ